MLRLLNFPVDPSLVARIDGALMLIVAFAIILALLLSALALIWFVATVVRDG